MKSTKSSEGVRKIWEKYKYVIVVTVIGIGLMLYPIGRRESREKETETRNIQREMEAILEKMEGVGQVKVMLTEENDGERKLAQDTELSYRSGDTVEYSKNSDTVLVDTGNRDEIVITRTLYPTYRGALIVCQGGGQASVRLAVTQAVAALTGLPTDCIAVEKWQ